MPRAGDLKPEAAIESAFADLAPAMTPDEARAESARCLFCFDAPCTRACPTAIDVPLFIRQILDRDEVGAARTILDANVFGGSCARACPTEVLCEGACVVGTHLRAPIEIGRLQRVACDAARDRGVRFFEAGPPTGRRVAVVGSGPAGLACAHELRRLGVEPVVFEARGVVGGLDATGIAAYKVSTAFAEAEVASILSIGIEVRVHRPVSAAEVAAMLGGDGGFDAVFLGVGLGRTARLDVEGGDLPGVWEALDFVEQTHAGPLAGCEVGRSVVVLGAGNTAIDAATAARRLGASSVTIAYRRGEASMSAFPFEYRLALSDGVRFEWFARPVRVVEGGGRAVGVEFARESPGDAPAAFVLPADMVIHAFGQASKFDLIAAIPGLDHRGGRPVVDFETGATSVRGLFAGGDCVRGGGEIVDAARDGKVAARGIVAAIRAGSGPIVID